MEPQRFTELQRMELRFGLPALHAWGPDIWSWFNARIGVQYTHYEKFDGTWNNVDGTNLKAGGNDAVFLYTWLMF